MFKSGEATSTGNRNRSRLGERAKSDPLSAATEILAAHRRNRGCATKTADALEVTPQTLRTIIEALSSPRRGALPLFSGDRTVLFDTAAGARPRGFATLVEAIGKMRDAVRDPSGGEAAAPSPAQVRRALNKLADHGAMAAVAAAVELDGGRTLDQGLLSRFKTGKKNLGPALRRKIMAAIGKVRSDRHVGVHGARAGRTG